MIEIPLSYLNPLEFKLDIKPSEKVGLKVIGYSQNHSWDMRYDFSWFEYKYFSMVFKTIDMCQKAAVMPLMDDSSRVDIAIGDLRSVYGTIRFSVEKYRGSVYVTETRSYIPKDRVEVRVTFFAPNGRYNPHSSSNSPEKLLEHHIEVCEKIKLACSMYKDILPDEFSMPDIDGLIGRLVKYKNELHLQCTTAFDK